ncbi:MAG: hypothetical protein QM817_07860 [Archangium sp.]
MRRFVVVLALGLLACERPVVLEPKNDGGAPRCLEVTPPTLDFGERELHTRGNLELTIDNPNTFTAQVSIAQVDPPFEVNAFLVDASLFVGPNTRLPINVAFQPFDSRLAFADVVFVTQTPENCPPITVRVSGLGSGELTVPQLVTLPPAPIGGTSASVITVSNSRREPVVVDVRVGLATFDGGVAGNLTLPPRVSVPALSMVDVPVQFTASTPGVQFATVFFHPSVGSAITTTVETISGMPHAVQKSAQLVIDPLPTSNNARRLLHLQNAGEGLLRLRNPRVVPGAGALPDEAEALLVSSPDVEPSAGAQVVIDLKPRHEGPARWTVLIDTNEPAQPTVSWDVQANIVPTPNCQYAVQARPTVVNVSGPYPTTAEITFSNLVATEPCLVTAFNFTTFNAWSTDLGDADSFTIDAGASVTRTITFTSPGTSFLQWVSHGTNLRSITLSAN